MGQKKLIRFEAIKGFENVFEYPVNAKGTWNGFFKNNNPITLELACGKGEYAVGLLKNVAFIRSHIDKVPDYFNAQEIEEIWITFPDPQLKGARAKKRLTHPKFLRLYQQILKPGGIIHLKTDSPDLYQFTKLIINLFELPLLEDMDNVYAGTNTKPELHIKTHYEGLDIAGSNRIHYLAFSINKELPLALDAQLKSLLSEH